MHGNKLNFSIRKRVGSNVENIEKEPPKVQNQILYNIGPCRPTSPFPLTTDAARDSAIQTPKTLLRNADVNWLELEAARNFGLENAFRIILLANSKQMLLSVPASERIL